MSFALVSHDGRVLSDTKDTLAPTPIETIEEPLHITAAKQHARDSTKKDTTK